MAKAKKSEAIPYFDRLRLRNVRCFRDTDVPLGPNVTVIIGENGAGKTTVIEALASLTHGDGEGLAEFPIRRGTQRGEISLFESGNRRRAASWTTRPAERKRLPEERYVFAYGRYRRVFFPQDGDADTRPLDPTLVLDELARAAGSRRTVTLNQPDNNLLRDLARYLSALNKGREFDSRLERTWNNLSATLGKLGHGISGIVMEEGEHDLIPKVVRNGTPLEIRELSDGYQALLVIILDVMLRYAYLFPQHENPLEGRALVAIDEVDLHLHPRWQRTAVAQLLEMFPTTQFVLTTHSPAVVQGAIDRKMKVVSLHEKDGGVAARPLGAPLMRSLQGAEIGSVLLDDRLFGVSSRYSPEFAKVEDRISELQKQIDSGAATDEDRQELFKHLDKMQELVVRDESRRADGAFLSQMSEIRLALLKDLNAEFEKVKS